MSLRRPHPKPPMRKAVSKARKALGKARRGPALPKKPRKRSPTINTGRKPSKAKKRTKAMPSDFFKKGGQIAIDAIRKHFGL